MTPQQSPRHDLGTQAATAARVLRRGAARLVCAAAATLAVGSALAAGFTVSGNQVLDPNGKAFVMRGINFPFSWYASKATQGFADVAATRANAVRVVLNSGQYAGATRTPGSEVSRAIQLCRSNRLVCVLEVHDATGWGDDGKAARLTAVAGYWTSADVLAAVKGQESWAIINIANEPVGNNQVGTWLADTRSAIGQLRAAGLTHLLMVDAPNWGQDGQRTMLNNARTVLQSDPLQRTMFSVHMYESYTTYTAARSYLDAFKATGTALVVGEFGPQNNGVNIDAAGIMKAAVETGTGYLGWSWSGNSGSFSSLDLVTSFGSRSFTSWGNLLVYGCNGIGATAQLATHFSATPAVVLPTATPTCNWYGNSYPLCTQTTTGTWGWENSASCVVKAACSALPAPYGVSGGSAACTVTPTPTPTPTVQACNWYGNLYPLCGSQATGWGWENNASCVGRNSCSALPAPYGVINQPTQCNWYGNTFPLCKSQSSGWGWENNASCVGFQSCAALPAPYGPK